MKYITITGAVLILVVILFYTVIHTGLKIRDGYISQFKTALSDVDAEYLNFCNRQYAGCIYKGIRIYFSFAALEKSLPVILPGEGSISIIIRAKIPGSSGTKFHLAVLPRDMSGVLRKISGWLNPEPGFFTGKVKGQEELEAAEVFQKLSSSSKNSLLLFASHNGNCAITPDWESVVIGKENSLQLAGGDREIQEQLDFQSTVPLNSSPAELILLLDEITEVVKSIARDLAV